MSITETSQIYPPNTQNIITAKELLTIPDDGCRYELVKGQLIKMSPSGHKHGKIAMRFTWRLARYVEEKGLGVVYAAETGFLLSCNPDTVRAPDAAFVSQKRLKEPGNIEGFFPGAPDIAVEVISPHDSYSKMHEKVIDWLTAGCLLVILIDPYKRSVTLCRSLKDIAILSSNETLDCGDIIPGWSLHIDELFD
jgi:Uma2 family endonuclease